MTIEDITPGYQFTFSAILYTVIGVERELGYFWALRNSDPYGPKHKFKIENGEIKRARPESSH